MKNIYRRKAEYLVELNPSGNTFRAYGSRFDAKGHIDVNGEITRLELGRWDKDKFTRATVDGAVLAGEWRQIQLDIP